MDNMNLEPSRSLPQLCFAARWLMQIHITWDNHLTTNLAKFITAVRRFSIPDRQRQGHSKGTWGCWWCTAPSWWQSGTALSLQFPLERCERHQCNFMVNYVPLNMLHYTVILYHPGNETSCSLMPMCPTTYKSQCKGSPLTICFATFTYTPLRCWILFSIWYSDQLTANTEDYYFS